MALCLCALITFAACSSESMLQSTSDEITPPEISSKDSTTSEYETTKETDDMQMVYEYETREIDTPINGQSIYGIAYIPQTTVKVPLVIFSMNLEAHTDPVFHMQKILLPTE